MYECTRMYVILVDVGIYVTRKLIFFLEMALYIYGIQLRRSQCLE